MGSPPIEAIDVIGSNERAAVFDDHDTPFVESFLDDSLQVAKTAQKALKPISIQN
jgi:hypothetical protein